MTDVNGQWLLHEDVFAGLERGLHHLEMRHRRGRERNRRDGWIGEQGVVLAVEGNRRVLRGEFSLHSFAIITESGKGAELMKLPDEILPQ